MKKLFGLTIAALLIIGMVGGGTWAYFSDPEASTDNSLAAGTLDLNWDGGNDSGAAVLSLIDKAPGDTGQGFKLIKNVGSLTGELDVATGVVTNAAGIGGTEYEGGTGELGGVALIAVYIDVDKGDTWTSGDVGLKNDDTTYTFSAATTGTSTSGSTTTVVDSGASWTVNQFTGLPVTVTGKGTRVVTSNTADTLTVATPFTSAVVNTDPYSIASGPHYSLINNYDTGSWGGASGIVNMAKDDEHKVYILWDIPATADNTIQGDSAKISFTFTLEQPAAD